MPLLLRQIKGYLKTQRSEVSAKLKFSGSLSVFHIRLCGTEPITKHSFGLPPSRRGENIVD